MTVRRRSAPTRQQRTSVALDSMGGPGGRRSSSVGDVLAEIILDDVWKVYPDGTVAVQSLDLEIDDKEFMVLVGPSGCGKTTALRMIAGLESVSEGTVRIGDRVVNDVPPKERDIAMVFQNYAPLPPHERVRQHGVRSQAPEGAEARDQHPRAGGGPHPRSRRAAEAQSPPRCPAGSASASRWGAPSCATRRRS